MIAPRALIAPALLGPPPFEVHVRPQREAVHVCPVGELDLATTARLRAEVEELAAAGFAQVVIDLRELDFMDCSGVGLLIALARAVRREGWRLSLFQGRDVRRLFALTGTLDALPVPPCDAGVAGAMGIPYRTNVAMSPPPVAPMPPGSGTRPRADRSCDRVRLYLGRRPPAHGGPHDVRHPVGQTRMGHGTGHQTARRHDGRAGV